MGKGFAFPALLSFIYERTFSQMLFNFSENDEYLEE
ncbi:hypothetical protein SAMN05192534_11411 [Alteribacillus persepolensis]|uniref:Uncharacterized protein n=1 Tax=Alteribacillus persepolensis TaxID=568899 RepID=A0A1G8G2B8_9BACI|nr:hypothetical protein SAMN05192534_11411 [Alteribacillus persepolensis]